MSAVVADTHAVIWYLQDHPRLSRAALTAMDSAARAGDAIYLSAISLVEVVYLEEKGRLHTGATASLLAAINDTGNALAVVALDLGVATCLAQIPRDQVPDMPDRIIAATARSLGLPLISRDHKIQLSAVQTIW